EPARLDARVVAGTLGTVGAVFRAAAALDVDERAELHRVGIEMAPMDRLCFEKQVVERQVEEGGDLFPAPAAAAGSSRGGNVCLGRRGGQHGLGLALRRPMIRC